MGWTDFVPIVGDIVDMIGNRMQAKDNWNMQQKQNQFNAKEAEKQREWASTERQASELFNHFQAIESRNWQEKMVNEQNEFNLPINQLRRMQDAGINPSMLEMDGSIKSASPVGNPQASSSTLGGASASSSGLIPAVNPFNNVDPILSVLQAKRLNAEIESIEDANMRENEKQPYVIETMKGNIYLIGTNIRLNETTRDSLEAQMPLYQAELTQINETIEAVKLDNDKRKKVLANWEREFEANMKSIDADVDYKISLTEKSRAEVNKILAETTSINQNNLINSIEFEVVKNNKSALVQLRYNQEKQEYDLYLEKVAADNAEARSRRSKAEMDKVYYDFLNGDTWQSGVHRGLNAFSRSIGFSAGISTNIPLKK